MKRFQTRCFSPEGAFSGGLRRHQRSIRLMQQGNSLQQVRQELNQFFVETDDPLFVGLS